MRTLLTLTGLIALGLSCAAYGGKPGKPAKTRELIIDVPSALAAVPADSVLLASANTALAVQPGGQDEPEPVAQHLSPKEFLSRVKVGSWQWENGTALQLTGDRLKLTYGEKTRFNLTLRPFKDHGTINLTIHRGF